MGDLMDEQMDNLDGVVNDKGVGSDKDDEE